MAETRNARAEGRKLGGKKQYRRPVLEKRGRLAEVTRGITDRVS